jgi:hypothetical protein
VVAEDILGIPPRPDHTRGNLTLYCSPNTALALFNPLYPKRPYTAPQPMPPCLGRFRYSIKVFEEVEPPRHAEFGDIVTGVYAPVRARRWRRFSLQDCLASTGAYTPRTMFPNRPGPSGHDSRVVACTDPPSLVLESGRTTVQYFHFSG